MTAFDDKWRRRQVASGSRSISRNVRSTVKRTTIARQFRFSLGHVGQCKVRIE